MASRCDSDSSRGRQTAKSAVPSAGSAKGSHPDSFSVSRGSTCAPATSISSRACFSQLSALDSWVREVE